MRQNDCHFDFVFPIIIGFWRRGRINIISEGRESDECWNSRKKEGIFIDLEANCVLHTII
jgi:hypothetical protein